MDAVEPGAAVSGATAAPGAFAPLRRPVYRALFVAQLASNVGTWMQVVGAQWLMGDLGGSALQVAFVQTAMTLPIFLAVVPAGVLGDLLDRRRLLIAAQAAMGVVALALALLTLSELTSPTTLLALTFVLGLGQALVLPSWQASMPDLVGAELVPQAAALNGASVNAARAVGPAVGGTLIALSGPGLVFAINAISFGATVLALRAWDRAPTVRTLGPERFGSAVRAGARYVRAAPALRTLLRRTFVFALPASALWALLPVLARGDLDLDAAGYGALLGTTGVGAVLGMVSLPRLRRRLSAARIVLYASMAFALGLAGLGVGRDVTAVALALPVLGASWICVLSSINATAHALLPAWARARGLSFYQLVFMGGQVVGTVGWGLLVEATSARTAFCAAGAVMALGLLDTWRRPLRSPAIDTTPSGHWPEPHVLLDATPQVGPVLVSVEYLVERGDAEAFRAAMAPVGRSRRRTGAMRWTLWQDAAQPRRFVETWEVATWGEHLRQHAERVTVRDESYERTAHGLLAKGSRPQVTHLLAAPLVPAHKAARWPSSAWPRRGRGDRA